MLWVFGRFWKLAMLPGISYNKHWLLFNIELSIWNSKTPQLFKVSMNHLVSWHNTSPLLIAQASSTITQQELRLHITLGYNASLTGAKSLSLHPLGEKVWGLIPNRLHTKQKNFFHRHLERVLIPLAVIFFSCWALCSTALTIAVSNTSFRFFWVRAEHSR